MKINTLAPLTRYYEANYPYGKMIYDEMNVGSTCSGLLLSIYLLQNFPMRQLLLGHLERGVICYYLMISTTVHMQLRSQIFKVNHDHSNFKNLCNLIDRVSSIRTCKTRFKHQCTIHFEPIFLHVERASLFEQFRYLIDKVYSIRICSMSCKSKIVNIK